MPPIWRLQCYQKMRKQYPYHSIPWALCTFHSSPLHQPPPTPTAPTTSPHPTAKFPQSHLKELQSFMPPSTFLTRTNGCTVGDDVRLEQKVVAAYDIRNMLAFAKWQVVLLEDCGFVWGNDLNMRFMTSFQWLIWLIWNWVLTLITCNSYISTTSICNHLNRIGEPSRIFLCGQVLASAVSSSLHLTTTKKYVLQPIDVCLWSCILLCPWPRSPSAVWIHCPPKSGFPSNRPQADGKASQTSSAKHETTDCLACKKSYNQQNPSGIQVISFSAWNDIHFCQKMLRITTCWSKKRGRFLRLAASFIFTTCSPKHLSHKHWQQRCTPPHYDPVCSGATPARSMLGIGKHHPSKRSAIELWIKKQKHSTTFCTTNPSKNVYCDNKRCRLMHYLSIWHISQCSIWWCHLMHESHKVIKTVA